MSSLTDLFWKAEFEAVTPEPGQTHSEACLELGLDFIRSMYLDLGPEVASDMLRHRILDEIRSMNTVMNALEMDPARRFPKAWTAILSLIKRGENNA